MSTSLSHIESEKSKIRKLMQNFLYRYFLPLLGIFLLIPVVEADPQQKQLQCSEYGMYQDEEEQWHLCDEQDNANSVGVDRIDPQPQQSDYDYTEEPFNEE